MIDIDLNNITSDMEDTDEMKREYENDLPDEDFSEEEEYDYYVERATQLVYQVRFFPDFALLRPAHPDYGSELERLPLLQFAQQYEEFLGDVENVRAFMYNLPHEPLIISRAEKKNRGKYYRG